MEHHRLPSPLAVSAANSSELVLSFRAILEASRKARGLDEPLEIVVPENPLQAPPAPSPERLWIPHLLSWENREAILLAWELTEPGALQQVLDAQPHEVARWAGRPELLLRLGGLAADGNGGPSTDGHLSLRWLMAHQEEAARALADEVVVVEHVSLHIAAEDEAEVAWVLTKGLGMVEIPRPETITVPGRWLQAGNARVHLNSRERASGEQGFPGTAPNHVCFAVEDIMATERELARLGVASKRAGSLSKPQLWIRLPGGTAIELQPRR